MVQGILDPTPGEKKFLFELSRLIPESFWVTQMNSQLRVGSTVRSAGKKGIVRLLFFNHLAPGLDAVGAVVAWEDGSITVPPAVLDFLGHQSEKGGA